MDTELSGLRERLQTERQQLAERLSEVDNQLSSIQTVLDLLKQQKNQGNTSQLPLLNINTVSDRLSGLPFKKSVKIILKDNLSKWWKPKDIFDTLLKEGFKSNSKDFNNTARNMLMNMRKNREVDIMKVSRGYMYKYKEEGSVPHMDETEPIDEAGDVPEG